MSLVLSFGVHMAIFREQCEEPIQIFRMIDAESVNKYVIRRDLKLSGHVVSIRELLQLGLLALVQWCGTRDITADGFKRLH